MGRSQRGLDEPCQRRRHPEHPRLNAVCAATARLRDGLVGNRPATKRDDVRPQRLPWRAMAVVGVAGATLPPGCTVGELLDDLTAWLRKDLGQVRVIRDGSVFNVTPVPLEELREVLSNALVHRSFAPGRKNRRIGELPHTPSGTRIVEPDVRYPRGRPGLPCRGRRARPLRRPGRRLPGAAGRWRRRLRACTRSLLRCLSMASTTPPPPRSATPAAASTRARASAAASLATESASALRSSEAPACPPWAPSRSFPRQCRRGERACDQPPVVGRSSPCTTPR